MSVGFILVVGVGHGTFCSLLLGGPLPCAAFAFDQFPIVAKEILKVAVRPLGGGGSPGAFQAAGDGVFAVSFTQLVFPAQALLLDGCAFWFGAYQIFGVGGAVRFAEGVSASDEGNGFFIVHGHTLESFADVYGGSEWVGLAIGALGIHIDEPHLYCGQWII